MRSIPFEVVCLLGMDDGSYPRPRRPLGFDLMADDYKSGDRSRREDDRYLFLEAILSARRVLYASYTGFDVRDSSSASRRCWSPTSCGTCRTASASTCATHPLQRSTRSTQGDERVQPRTTCRARRAGHAERAGGAASSGRSASRRRVADIALDDLVQFYRNPARFFLRECLDLRLDPARGEVDTREPFVLDALERYRLGDEVAAPALRGAAAEVAALVRAAGHLPHGVVGDVAFEAQIANVESLVARPSRRSRPRGTPPVAIDVEPPASAHGALSVRGSAGSSTSGRPAPSRAIGLVWPGTWRSPAPARVARAAGSARTAR
jgi:exodeoxyribonuclease V gamma subunit